MSKARGTDFLLQMPDASSPNLTGGGKASREVVLRFGSFLPTELTHSASNYWRNSNL